MKQRTIVISDLHLGGGAADPGDDHVYQEGQLGRFVSELTKSDQGQHGLIELFINGDFLEFAQTDQGAYQGSNARHWCTEAESLRKLKVILDGHADAFAALGRFIEKDNCVTIAAGNHDVDLYWPAVRSELQRRVHGALRFELGAEWVERHSGRLQIAHGHLPDPANTFRHWNDPRLDGDAGEKRLEMCPGTLFMVKLVNGLEQRFPYADNVYPIQRFAALLAREETKAFFPMAWAFLRFASRHPFVMSKQSDRYGDWLLKRIHHEDELAMALCEAVHLEGPELSVEALRARIVDEFTLSRFVMEHWSSLEASGAAQRIAPLQKHVLGHGGATGKTLGRIKAGGEFGKGSLRLVALERADRDAAVEVVVMGHTHIPDDFALNERARYFNPGSWTRYVDLEAHPEITLDDLVAESRFPYSLRYVCVDAPAGGGQLTASLETFEAKPAEFQLARFGIP